MTKHRLTRHTGLAVGLLLLTTPLHAQEASLNAPLTLHAPSGFALRGTAVTADGDGLRAHGRLCRVGGVGPWPSHVRLDLLAATGEVASDAVASIGPVSSRQIGCVIFRLSSPWQPQAGQSLRLSAS